MRTIERTLWTCENCRRKNTGARKRCADCGTTRH
ncbi:putative ATP-dependent serine protease [Modestobacter marinus]|uniref:Putative ATP-dependent serine protease n=1 Tax=Modestobacter marinus TaxID=477641 RepID=A0A846LL09_9ACTN|nr:putative ATP-dependent serine protease [Modestobacter marinus]